MEILVENFSAEVGKEGIFKPTVGYDSVCKIM
jgi:hypothetical protein